MCTLRGHYTSSLVTLPPFSSSSSSTPHKHCSDPNDAHHKHFTGRERERDRERSHSKTPYILSGNMKVYDQRVTRWSTHTVEMLHDQKTDTQSGWSTPTRLNIPNFSSHMVVKFRH